MDAVQRPDQWHKRHSRQPITALRKRLICRGSCFYPGIDGGASPLSGPNSKTHSAIRLDQCDLNGKAGLLVGIGTIYGYGCTSGHGVCGLARLSYRSLVATLIFMATGFATVFV